VRRNPLFLWIFLVIVAPIGAVVVVCALLLFGVSAHAVFTPGRAVQTFLHAPRAVGVLGTVALWWAIIAALGLAWERRGRTF
jgi:hypothetical protein